MRIVVCVKQINHTYARTGMDPSLDYIAPEDRVVRTNPYDEVAMELAVRLKEKSADSHITAVTLGPVLSKEELGRCLAMGADECIQLDCRGDLDPWEKSLILSRAISLVEGELIFCGRESLDTGNGQVGQFVARHLRLPYIGPLLECEVDPARNTVRGLRKGARGVRQSMESSMPAVVGVDMGGVDGRLPPYEDRIRAQAIPIRRIKVNSESTPKSEKKRVFSPRPRPRSVPTPDSTLPASKRIEFLLSGSRIEKKGETLRGDPDAAAEGILAYLEKEGFLG